MQLSKIIIGLSALAALSGCSDGDSVSKNTASTITGTAVDFATGLGKGVDEKMLVAVESEPALESAGLKATLGKSRDGVSNRSTIYVVATNAYKGAIVAKALDANGNEIGRAQTDIDLKQDDASYVDLQFPEQMDSSLVRKYRVTVR